MDFLQLPVTLVVKAPNQKIADQTVECALDWTIHKLKQHLSTVYPSQPRENQQRIIYSGKLLKDELQLKDILHQFEPDQMTHTVHLVCSNPEMHTMKDTSPAPVKEDKPDSRPNSSTSSQHQESAPQPDVTTTTEGLRHRHPPQSTESASPSTSTTPQTAAHPPHPVYPHMGGMNNGPAGYPVTTAMPPFPGLSYSPEQMLWFQQMYAQQMAQYMQYYQGAVPTTQGGELDPPLANQAEAHQAPAGAAPAGGQARNPGMVMNAGGGAVMDEEDDENVNRDWLDWLYTLSRFSVLLSIVYFYSTFSRFVMVLGAFLLIYLYQAGRFRLQRRAVRPPEVPQNQQEDLQNAENARREDASADSEESETPAESEESATPASPPADPPANILQTFFSFITGFFTSLIPQTPAPVNIN